MTQAPPAERVGRPAVAPLWRGLLRRLARHRHWVAAALVGVAAAIALGTVRPPRPPTEPAVVAAHDLAAGQVLVAADLVEVARSPATLPDGAVTGPSGLLGRTVAGPVRRGEIMTDARVVGPGLLRGLAGLVAAPARVADSASTSMVRVGDVVDVLAAGAGDAADGPRAEVVAEGALVLALPGQSPADAADGQGWGGSADGAMLLLAVRPEAARALAAAATAARLSLVLRNEATAAQVVH